MYLIDSDILIDYLRLYEPAIEFLDNLKKDERGLSFITKFELIRGCKKKINEKRSFRLLDRFKVLPLDEEIAERAFLLYKNIRWSVDIGMADSMIAATAIHNKCTLATRNLKHFSKIPGLKVKKPY